MALDMVSEDNYGIKTSMADEPVHGQLHVNLGLPSVYFNSFN